MFPETDTAKLPTAGAPVSDMPLTAGVANAVLNADYPPELAIPETTRNALPFCLVCFVHPVGAAAC